MSWDAAGWDAIGALGEIAGATAVFVTLIVLIAQLRQNTREVRAASIQSLLQSSTELFSHTINSPIPDIISKRESGEPLSPGEQYRFNMFFRRNLQLFEQVYFQHSQGRLSDEVMHAYRERLLNHVRMPAWEEQWPVIRPFTTRSFQKYVEDVMHDA